MKIEQAYLNIGRLDRMGYGSSPMHAFDPRAKLVVATVVIVAVVSFPKYEVVGLLPFFLFPACVLAAGDIPVGFLAVRLLIASPFALGVGIFNPFLDPTPVAVFGDLSVAAGWFSFASILLRFALTVSMAILLVATTSMPGVGEAMVRLRFPRFFVLQILLVYRYVFVLVEEGMRLVRARNARGGTRKGTGLRVYGSMLASLFVRTSDRAGRIHRAMLARGFDGELRRINRGVFRTRDGVLLIGGVLVAVLFRLLPVARIIGDVVTGPGGGG